MTGRRGDRRSVKPWNFDLFFLGRDPQLFERAGLDLADPLLGDAHLDADFFQREGLVTMVQSEAADNDFLLALVKPLQDSADLGLTLLLGRFLFVLIRTVFLSAVEHLRMTGAKPVAVAMLVGNRPGEVLHDRPTGVRAELVAAG